MDVLRRESIYLWYYFTVQLEQIFPYWLLDMAIGSVVSVFGKERINRLFSGMRDKNLGLFGIVPPAFWASPRRCACTARFPLPLPFPKKGCGTTGWHRL